MRAILCERFGDPAEVLAVRDVPDPVCRPGELLVRVSARSVNPSDLLTVRGVYSRTTPLPFVPGFEAVGRVVAVGDGVSAEWLGRRVLPLRGGGTWAELVTCPAEWAVPVPDAIPDAVATQAYINPITVRRLLTVEIPPPPPRGRDGVGVVRESVPSPLPTLTLPTADAAGPLPLPGRERDTAPLLLVNAAGSACGRIAAQEARRLGLRLLAVTRSDAYTDELLALGATVVVNTTHDDLAAAVRGLTGGRGADAALDAIGGETGATLADLIAPGGTLVSYGLLSGSLVPPDLPRAKERGVKVLPFWLKRWVDTCTPEDWHETFRDVLDDIAAGRLVLPVGPVHELADIAAAMRSAAASGRRGKVVLAG